jgi:hypothetical protein
LTIQSKMSSARLGQEPLVLRKRARIESRVICFMVHYETRRFNLSL